MACVGCSQTGSCACAVVGGSNGPVVTGTGAPGSPYAIELDETNFVAAWPDATPDLCVTATQVLAQLQDGSLAWIPAPKRCARIV